MHRAITSTTWHARAFCYAPQRFGGLYLAEEVNHNLRLPFIQIAALQQYLHGLPQSDIWTCIDIHSSEVVCGGRAFGSVDLR